MDEYLADVTVGDVHEFGVYEVTAEEIREFARAYDPQPFHLDPEAARASLFGELVASGWHTAAMTMRLLVDNYLNESGAQGSPGVDALRWPAPVVAGDSLSVRSEVTDTEPWDDERGVAHTAVTTTNQADETVLSMEARLLFPRRP